MNTTGDSSTMILHGIGGSTFMGHDGDTHTTWLCAMVGSLLVGLSGILPVFIIPLDTGEKLASSSGASRLQHLLSFAVGSLLGDVFLHLLPEAWAHIQHRSGEQSNYSYCGMFVIMGMLTFILIEKVFSQQTKEVTGYLNLLANCIDNFTHGLAVAGSFLVGFKVGALTTFAILVHEIPHEIGDFAILLKSGFSRWQAAKAQLLTACGGLLGAIVTLVIDSSESLGDATSWILPFTAGGFLNIALVSVLPDLLDGQHQPKEAIKHCVAMLLGVIVMYVVTITFD